MLHAGSMTSGSAPSAYSNTWRAPSHVHNFPSVSLIGPSGAKAGPHPIEGNNYYPYTYDVGSLGSSSGGGSASSSPTTVGPFLRGGNGSIRGGDGVLTSPSPPFSSVGVSQMGTTRELFAGSSKHGQIRIPGYQGYIPHSAANHSSLRGGPPGNRSGPGGQLQPAAKDPILLSTFSHDMPGYAGHQPQCVVNVRGPRSPRGKKRLNEGLVASLILDSMKI